MVVARQALTHFHVQLEDPPASSPDGPVRSQVFGDAALDGQIAEYTPPSLILRILDWPTHTDGVQAVDGGIEDMQATVTSLRYTGEFYRLFNNECKMVCYNALRSGQAFDRLRHELTGVIITVDPGTVSTGTTAPQLTIIQNVAKYKVVQNTITAEGVVGPDVVLVDIDVDSRKRMIGTVDQLAAVKAALGIT